MKNKVLISFCLLLGIAIVVLILSIFEVIPEIRIPDKITAEDVEAIKNAAIDKASYNYKIVDDGIVITKYTGTEVNVVVPETIESKPIRKIGAYSFTGTKVVTVELPSTVVEIEDMAFGNCLDLKAVKLPEGLRIIDVRVFYGCNKLKKIILPDSLERVGTEAFGLWYDSQVIKMNSGLDYSSWSEDWYKLSNALIVHSDDMGNGILLRKIDDGYSAYAYVGTEPDLEIPREYNGLPITHIAQDAFGQNALHPMTSIFVPNTVYKVELNAFDSIIGETSTIYLEYGTNRSEWADVVKHGNILVENYDFDSCYSVEPNKTGLTLRSYYGDYRNIIIPDTITGIPVTAIDSYMLDFDLRETVESITIGSNIDRIGSSAFSHCTNVESIVIPKSVKMMEDQIFGSWNPEQVVYIEKGAPTSSWLGWKWFSDARFVENYVPGVDLGYSVDHGRAIITGYVGTDKNVILPDVIEHKSVYKLDNYAFRDLGIESIRLPEHLEVIDYEVFSGCKDLKEIAIPDTVEKIGTEAFLNCRSIKEIVIPESVEYVGNNAFGGWTDNQTIIIENSESYVERYWSKTWANSTEANIIYR